MFQQIIAKTARALAEAEIPYMIIGGQAVLRYGIVRVTKDIDITLGVNIDGLPQILEVVRGLNLKILPKDYEHFVSRTMVLPVEDGKSGIRIDFVFSFLPYERQAIKRSRKVKLGAAIVRFASLEDILIHKIFSGRAKDIEDAKGIILKHPEFDARYIRKWLRQLSDTGESRLNLVHVFNSLLSELQQS